MQFSVIHHSLVWLVFGIRFLPPCFWFERIRVCRSGEKSNQILNRKVLATEPVFGLTFLPASSLSIQHIRIDVKGCSAKFLGTLSLVHVSLSFAV